MNKIIVKSDVFDFYRKEYGLSVDELADKTGLRASDIQMWCDNDSQISVSVLRKLANIYKKHWGIFLIQSTGTYFKKPKDFRGRGSSKLGLEAMLAFEEASRLIEVGRIVYGKAISQDFAGLHKYKNDAAALASACRKTLDVTSDRQRSWQKPEDAYLYLREVLETKGLVVSEQPILNEELDGFVVKTRDGAAIVVNKSDKSIYRRMFTLLHELGHFLQGVSASCEPYEGTGSNNSSDEVFANEFASNFFLPKPLMNNDPIIQRVRSSGNVVQGDYQALSKKYSVSMSAVAVWLCKEKIITPEECDTKITEFTQLYKDNRDKQLAKSKEKGGFDPKGHERKAVNRVGKNLTREIINNYHEGNMSVRDAAASLNVKVHLVDKIDNLIAHGSQ